MIWRKLKVIIVLHLFVVLCADRHITVGDITPREGYTKEEKKKLEEASRTGLTLTTKLPNLRLRLIGSHAELRSRDVAR